MDGYGYKQVSLALFIEEGPSVASINQCYHCYVTQRNATQRGIHTPLPSFTFLFSQFPLFLNK